MSKIGYFFRCLLGLQDARIDAQPPRDEREFHEAKKQLKDTSRIFSRQIDRFGDMVFGMQERPLPKKKRVRKRLPPQSTKKRPRKR